jgi:hypothetical protein
MGDRPALFAPGEQMNIWTIAMVILALTIVVVDYRRLAACGRRRRAAARAVPGRPLLGTPPQQRSSTDVPVG